MNEFFIGQRKAEENRETAPVALLAPSPSTDVLHFPIIDCRLAVIGPLLVLNGTVGSEMSFMCLS